MESRLVQFTNCRLLRDHALVKDDLWVRKGKIENPEKLFFDERVSADLQVDCQGAVVAPGFIDLQINGGFGIDFSHDVAKVEEGVAKVAKGILAHGVTSFCPTLVTSPDQLYHQILPRIQVNQGGAHGASVLGVHLEGPFISPMKKGAHPAEYIKTFDKGFQSVLDVYSTLENVSIVTLAPELPNAPAVVKELSGRNVTVSVGHSMGDLVHGEVAVRHGATFITHLFNAMLPFHHRDPGIVGLLTSDAVPEGKTVFFGIIADGIHTHPAALRIAQRTHPAGLVLVTDAISALGLQEGTHQLGQMVVQVRDSHAFVAGTTTLCGSIANMIECVQHFAKATGCSMVTALEAASLHPAQTLGIDKRKGTLDFGADADFIFLNEDYSIRSTWIAGECVYRNPEVGEK